VGSRSTTPAVPLGLYLRNMGPQATRETLRGCALAAEDAGVDELWVADHVAIPPDDAEGSGGRYLDPLATLAFLAGATSRIGLGTAVLVVPYRPALPTAKWIATIQELSGERLRLGVGAGWMAAEFRALGVERAHRGAITDATLAFLHRCFADDVATANGQPFLFLPRPARPPIFVGGAPPHALRRAVRHGDGWMPMGLDAAALAPAAAELQRLAADAGRGRLEVVALTRLPLDRPDAAGTQARALVAAGATRLVHAWRYADVDDVRRAAAVLAGPVRAALAAG